MPVRTLPLLLLLTLTVPASAPAQSLITEPTSTLTPVYNLLSSATRSVDLTMYEFVDTKAQQLLAQQAAKGVTIRVILDQNLEKKANTPAYTFLNAHGVQAVWAAKQYAATHQKTATIDGKISAIMTLNFTSRYYSSSRDFAFIDTNPQDVAAIQQTFNSDFAAAAITPPLGADLVWSPTNADTAFTTLIQSATKTLAIENEEMSARDIVAAIAAAATRGVDVSLTMTLNPAYATQYATLTAAGVHIRTYAQNAPLYIHAKIVIVDTGLPTQRALLGSENFSTYSLTRNRELGLTLTDPATLQSLTNTLTADFNGAVPWTPAAAHTNARIAVRPPS